jgi:hypothetical protein
VTPERGRSAAALLALVCLGVTLVAGGCGRGDGGGASLGFRPSRLAQVERRFERSLDSCAAGDSGCTWVRMRWPQYTAAPSRATRDSLNAWVHAQVLTSESPDDSTVTTPEAYAARFLTQNRQFRSDFPDASSSAWYQDVSVETFGDTLGVISLRATTERFGGGAHPLRTVWFGAFDARTGRRLKLDDLVAPGRRATLDSLGEHAFRAAREIPSSRSLKDESFAFEGDRFRLNDNFGVGENGLTVEFNPYEVAPYVVGPTSITLGWSAVRDLLVLPPGR